jgi:sulfatase maturation enzyme AslB (radical SAM superfamily)
VVEYSRNKAKVLQKKLNFALVTNLSLMDKEKLNFLMQNNI